MLVPLFVAIEVNRIIRALEIFEITGEIPSKKRKGERVLNRNLDPILIFLNYKDRKILYNRINDRVNDMITLGLIDEFKYLLKKYNLDENSQSMAAIGYKELFPYIRGEMSLEETISLIQRNTRRYAKRQITWMKRYLDYQFTREIIMDDLSKDDATAIIEDLIKDMYEFISIIQVVYGLLSIIIVLMIIKYSKRLSSDLIWI